MFTLYDPRRFTTCARAPEYFVKRKRRGTKKHGPAHNGSTFQDHLTPPARNTERERERHGFFPFDDIPARDTLGPRRIYRNFSSSGPEKLRGLRFLYSPPLQRPCRTRGRTRGRTMSARVFHAREEAFGKRPRTCPCPALREFISGVTTTATPCWRLCFLYRHCTRSKLRTNGPFDTHYAFAVTLIRKKQEKKPRIIAVPPPLAINIQKKKGQYIKIPIARRK